MLNDALLHVRYRPLGDTAAIHVDLPPALVTSTMRDDRDVDQILEWARLTDGMTVLHDALVLHVRPLLAVDELALPAGALLALRALLELAPSYAQASELAVRCAVDTLLKRPTARRQVRQEPLFHLPPMRSEHGRARRELSACATTWPNRRVSGTEAAARLSGYQQSTRLFDAFQMRHDAGRPKGGAWS